MSGTTRTADAPTAASESWSKARQAASSLNGTGDSKETAQKVSETVAEAVDTAAALSSKVVADAREAMMTGVRTAASVGGRVADVSFSRSHELLTSAARTMDVYRDASERSAERMQGLFSSWMAMGRGFQKMQHAWLEIVDHAIDHAAHKPHDLLQCKTIVEVAGVQRDIYIDAVDQAMQSGSRMLEMINDTAREAARPLQTRQN